MNSTKISSPEIPSVIEGNYNVAIGHGAGMTLTKENNKVLIGHGVELDSDDVVKIGVAEDGKPHVVFSKPVWEAICKSLKDECNLEHEHIYDHFTENGITVLREKYADKIDASGNLSLGFDSLTKTTTGTESGPFGETNLSGKRVEDESSAH